MGMQKRKPPHGQYSRYRTYGCRCRKCVKTFRAHQRRWQHSYRLRQFGCERAAVRQAKIDADLKRAKRLFTLNHTLADIAEEIGRSRMWLWRHGMRG
jgi:hypothetical protein